MAAEVRHFAVTVAKGSTPAAPQETNIRFPDRVVVRIEVDVPPGPKGQVGFYIASSGAQLVPFTETPPLYVVADDRPLAWDLHDQPTSGDWQLIAYNIGNYPHTLRVTFLLNLTGKSDAGFAVPSVIPASALSS